MKDERFIGDWSKNNGLIREQDAESRNQRPTTVSWAEDRRKNNSESFMQSLSCSETGNRRRGSSEQEEKDPLPVLNPEFFL